MTRRWGSLGHDWFSILRCPYCRASFEFREAQPPAEGAAEFGVLRCGCSAFPVVDGVPIIQRAPVGMFEHTTGATQVSGVPVGDVVRLIERGRTLDALLECLAVPALPSMARRLLPWRIANSGAVVRLSRWLGKRAVRTEVLARRETVSAREVFEFYYRPAGPLGVGVGEYFILRFGQPRHLAALALISTIPANDKPVLDVACGMGHIEHYLTERNNSLKAVGTDMNFFQVWIARHWIAPAGCFLCANAQDGLPFDDDAFSAVVCSDAYHYIANRQDLRREIERCAPGQPVFLTRVGNRAVMPNEGLESTLRDYLEEFDTVGVRSFSEADLVRAYLRRKNPFVEPASHRQHLSESKWLSFAWNVPPVLQDPPWEPNAQPHATGQLGLNPVYRSTPAKNGDLHLRFEFPSAWYAYENHGMLAYHPQTATIASSALEQLSAWRDDASLSALAESFVLIGLPRRF